MCDPVSATLGVVGTASGFMDVKNQNKAWAAAETARRKQKIEMVRQANMQDANLKLQENDSFKAARLELESQTMQAIKAKGAVHTAMMESNLEGRSMDRVMRDTENVYLRTRGLIQENYERDYHNIWVQRETNRDQLISALEAMPPQAPKPNVVSQTLGVVQGGIQGAIVGQNLWGTMTSDPNLQSNKPSKSKSTNTTGKT